MNSKNAPRIAMRIEARQWPLRAPFLISGYRFTAVDVLTVTLDDRRAVGRGEAAGVYYHHETPSSMARQLDASRDVIEAGANRFEVQQMLPAGGARNALDCALWELESRRSGKPVHELAGIGKSQPLRTTFTIGAGDPAHMAVEARGWKDATAIKLKLTGSEEDAERVRAVRAARPDVWLMVDANQGFTPDTLHALMPALVAARVQLIEQPFPIDRDAWMGTLQSPIRVAADESFQDRHDFDRIAGRFDMVNIKLDKCGGLTEALAIADEARRRGLGLMTGNMGGTSLAMAPALVVAQLCDVADLDGPVQLADDLSPSVRYENGNVCCPDDVWGASLSA
ncbi:MAG TPA: dipeptide epimerase [Rhodanobacteraceae bacterium]